MGGRRFDEFSDMNESTAFRKDAFSPKSVFSDSIGMGSRTVYFLLRRRCGPGFESSIDRQLGLELEGCRSSVSCLGQQTGTKSSTLAMNAHTLYIHVDTRPPVKGRRLWEALWLPSSGLTDK